MSETQTAETFKGTTHIGVVLDKSGSMGAVRRETIGGFNAWLAQMQNESGDIRLSLTLFDTGYSTPVKEAPIGKVNPLDESRYQPSGSTALLDAVKDSIEALGGVEAVNGSDRYLICILTDGEENASHKTTKEDLAELIRQKEATGRWTFAYLSAGMDAFADAASIGVRAGNTMAYKGDPHGTHRAFAAAALSTISYSRSGVTMDSCFFNGADHADQVGPDLQDALAQIQAAAQPAPAASFGWLNDATAAPAATSGWVSS